jgi:hypothetical protein
MRKLLVGAAATIMLAGLALPTASSAFGVQVVRETSDGYVGAIPGSDPQILVGSDAESPFDPFGVGFDTSDEIQLNQDWAPLPNNGWSAATNVANVWYASAAGENEPKNEAIGRWYFTPGGGWTAGTKSLLILDDDGVSDFIRIANNGPGGTATITFRSDPLPQNVGVPEPAEWGMLLMGIGMIGAVARTLRRKEAVTAA